MTKPPPVRCNGLAAEFASEDMLLKPKVAKMAVESNPDAGLVFAQMLVLYTVGAFSGSLHSSHLIVFYVVRPWIACALHVLKSLASGLLSLLAGQVYDPHVLACVSLALWPLRRHFYVQSPSIWSVYGFCLSWRSRPFSSSEHPPFAEMTLLFKRRRCATSVCYVFDSTFSCLDEGLGTRVCGGGVGRGSVG